MLLPEVESDPILNARDFFVGQAGVEQDPSVAQTLNRQRRQLEHRPIVADEGWSLRQIGVLRFAKVSESPHSTCPNSTPPIRAMASRRIGSITWA